MPSFRIVLVEPEYPLNIGAVCRAMANFNFSELVLVNPKCEAKGFEAEMFSKHAKGILKKAKTVKKLEQAIGGCDFIVGTSGVINRHKKTIRNPLRLKEFISKLSSASSSTKYAILFGREGIGLSEAELNKCDFLIHVPTSTKYPIMNLSHAAAVVLYEIFSSQKNASKKMAFKIPAKPLAREKLQLLKYFDEIAEAQKGISNPKKIKAAFRRVLGRSMVTDDEVRSLLAFFSRLKKC
ncbi:tRNA (cytidine(34)-2'-O)-methyltransferase [Candidatus Gugararchaeum adminiculabundum]|nr:tRNA (cytidine(34)-2'-O)-methyltransferase [Candidatus Gugararchaeum adminiculabundum]